ncbi:glycosyl transferase [Prevotella sp. P3-120]|uniref:glycosyltransferase n=1 Tax=unclassified Prevotella TaxID=2638335 RepID=UPI000B961B04|nr:MULTISPECIES: glycogen/starch synthase [unclassified Prevotella]MBS7319678.1 glycogen/starch synthase [Prevotella sp.]MCF2559592.1 glycogen/starch synthase [Xylanibacter brevis]MDD7171993.1 glycogen/starch synthase [Prevotella sp.]MDY4683712.1 glycogen/starch synthase [Prevotella sp.]OYP40201.1 glycosyl transferase [Prevotella sp. P5-50]
MGKELIKPDYVFESSWEVCNKVGGIYTVLSSRAKTLQDAMCDRIIFIGPDVWHDNESPYFQEEKSLLAEWQWQAKEEGLKVKVGRWAVPGKPIAILVDFQPFFEKKNEIYGWLWEHYQVDSLHAYGDYDEASMFSYAAALVVESIYRWLGKEVEGKHVIYHANEWMCGLGALYINNVLPQIGTVFTTHATSIGRSIAGNQKPLYDYLFAYNGDQMAEELNMQSKHSIEKQTAHYVDCFTTVSDITANECRELLDKPVDVVLPNGFDNSFVPKAATFTKKRKAARKRLLDVANALLGESLDDDTLIVSTSGRYEFRNKGIDVFVEAMNRLLRDRELKKKVLAFIEVPGWVGEPRKDLQERLAKNEKYETPLDVPQLTHWLHNMSHDNVLGMMKYYDMHNRKDDKVKVIFLPCYLDGRDGIVNMSYYDVVLGNDLCIYPSYYEPWGYTPLEAVAFKVPCITTDLAGFGLWANGVFGHAGEIEDGVKVIHRTDYNYSEVADAIKDTVAKYSAMPKNDVESCRRKADALSKKALWSEFIEYYYEAYDIALRKAQNRMNK